MKIMDRPIAFHRAFVEVGGSITAALFLSQAVYWQTRCNRKDGWWYKDQDEWKEETGMGRREQETARKKLKSAGVLEEKKEGIPARLWYRVNVEKLSEKLGISTDWRNPPNKDDGLQQARMAESAKQAWRNPPNRPGGIRQTLKGTETTTEITTETTTTTEKPNNILNESDDSGSSSSGFSLIFDFSLSNWPETRKRRAEKALENLDQETAQIVLDELNDRMSNGRINKPIAWLSNVAAKARAGEFVPTSEIPDLREVEQRRQNNIAQKEGAKPSRIWIDHRDNLKTQFGDEEFNRNIVPLRGLEHGEVLILEAPNRFVADWVQQNMKVIQNVIGMHTDNTPEVRIKIG